MELLAGCLIALGVFLLVVGLAWLLFCGAYALICFCFGLVFSWPIATGIFIILAIIYLLFRAAINHNN